MALGLCIGSVVWRGQEFGGQNRNGRSQEVVSRRYIVTQIKKELYSRELTHYV